MGGGDLAMLGDVRSVFFNPAALAEMNGLEVYAHGANPYYILGAAHYSNAGLAYRLSDRFAIAAHYNRFDWNWAESGWVLVDPVGNPSGAWGANSQDRTEQYSMSVSGRLARGLSVGLQGTWLRTGFPVEMDVPMVTMSAHQVILNKSSGTWRQSLRAAAAWQNISGERAIHEDEERRGFSYDIDEPIPSTVRLAASATIACHSGWLSDSARIAAFTLHVQYDDDVNDHYRTAFRAGAELELLRILLVRAGWFRQEVYDYGWPKDNKNVLSDVTYGLGVNVPIQEWSKGKVPVSITLDYVRMPQVSYSQDDNSPITDEPWEDFESFGLRVNYGLGRIFKKKPVTGT